MIDPNTAQRLIKENMPVVGSEDGQFAVIDHMEGADAIKLAKDNDGQHHYIPLTWVTAVDDKVHIDRPGDQAMKEWSTAPAPASIEAPAVTAPRHVNSVDATIGQPIVTRVMARKQELEGLLAQLPDDDVRTRGNIVMALDTINELLTGDLEHVPAVVVADMSRWLERNKHVAESAVESVVDPVTAPVAAKTEAGPMPGGN
jgi:hypothetical protein